MAGLAADDLLRLWEAGAAQHPLDRALTMLAAAMPAVTRGEFAQLPIGQRDARLLTVYARTFGEQIACRGRCPQCGQAVEFTLQARDLLAAAGAGEWEQPLTTSSEGYAVTYRLPDSFDLAAIARLPDVRAARQRLLERCIVQATCAGAAVGPDQLPEDVVGLVVAQMAAHDPLAVIELEPACPDCGCRWQLLFDIVAFLWLKIEVQAERLLRDVHALARAHTVGARPISWP